MSRHDFEGNWVVTCVCGDTSEKVGNKITTTAEGKERIRIESCGGDHSSCQTASWEPVSGTPGKLVFTRSGYDCTIELQRSPGGRALHCVEKKPDVDTGSWTADDSTGPWEEC